MPDDVLLFFRSAQRFHGVFFFQGVGTVSAGFLMNDLHRTPAARIPRGRAAVMLRLATCEIIRNTGVERAVAALQDIEMPAVRRLSCFFPR